MYKETLIKIIESRLSQKQCADILTRICHSALSHHRLLKNKSLANEWDESEHPREDDGKFAAKGSVSRTGRNEELDEMLEDFMLDDYVVATRSGKKRDLPSLTPTTKMEKLLGEDNPLYHDDIPSNHLARVPADLRPNFECWEEAQEISKYVDEGRRLDKRRGNENHWGFTPREYAILALYDLQAEKPGWLWSTASTGEHIANDALGKQIGLLEVIKEIEEMEFDSKANTRKAKLYKKKLEQIDDFEEKYADREKGSGLKWPETQEAVRDRKKYLALIRETKLLDRQIDWSKIKDDEPSEQQGDDA